VIGLFLPLAPNSSHFHHLILQSLNFIFNIFEIVHPTSVAPEIEHVETPEEAKACVRWAQWRMDCGLV
jgi:hypothetical protein